MSRETQISLSSGSSRRDSRRLLLQIGFVLLAVLLTLFYVGLLFSGIGVNFLSSVLIHGASPASELFDGCLLLFIPPYAISMVLWWYRSRYYRARIKILSRVAMFLSFLVLLYLVSVSASFDLLMTML